MSYRGRELTAGNYLKLDDLQSQFNSSTTTFNLTSGGNAFYPGSAFSIQVVLGGVIQEPESAYTINQNQITFATAPVSGDDFFCIALGVSLGVGVPGEGTVSGTKLTKPFNYDDGLLYLDSTNNRIGVNSTTPTEALDVVGNVKVSGTITASLTGTATSTTNIPNLTGAITSNNTTTSLGSFTSANLATALTDETGSGANVFATSPTLITPVLGAATATSIVVSSGSTFTNGPILVGTATSTGTANQTLQVTGGAYVSGNLGVGINNPTALLHCFAPDATNTVAYFRVTNSSVGSGLYRNVHIDGTHPNGASFWKGIDITPTQAITAPMTGIDMSWDQIYAEARGVNINVIKNTHSGGGNGIGVFSRVSASGVSDRAYEAIGGWFITDKETGALDPYTSYTLKVENRSTTGITNLVSFYTDSTTQRGSIYYDRTNNALTLSGNNAFRIDSNGSSRLFINSSGNTGIGTTNPQYTLHVVGSFAATTKSFVIDHPTKTNHKLRYGSLESPYHGIRITGNGTIKDGKCIVNLPEYISALVHNDGINIQITNIKHGKSLWVDEIDIINNKFVIMAEEILGEYDFYWDFTAIRKDVEPMIVEFKE